MIIFNEDRYTATWREKFENCWYAFPHLTRYEWYHYVVYFTIRRYSFYGNPMNGSLVPCYMCDALYW